MQNIMRHKFFNSQSVATIGEHKNYWRRVQTKNNGEVPYTPTPVGQIYTELLQQEDKLEHKTNLSEAHAEGEDPYRLNTANTCTELLGKTKLKGKQSYTVQRVNREFLNF
jgi:hypothetical protein